MTGLQAQLDKIRSDAAECLMLGRLAPDGKRDVFIRVGEHLNALALELEKTRATTAKIATDATPQAEPADPVAQSPQADPADPVAAPNGAARGRQIIAWLLVILFGALAAGWFLWANKSPGSDRPPVTSVSSQPKPEPAPAAQENAGHAIRSSGEDGGRDVLREQVDALAARLDRLEKDLEGLKVAHNESAEPSKKDVTSQSDDQTTAATKPAGSEQKASKQTESVPLIGPPGCMQFRSYDPASGTYTALNGRRRPCR
ncbi:hypothetical protein BRAS3843_2770066 [Bradyrhizobium sp. STM 3843]|uniref:BA14K family protein n=1 Tax=Bradyrhizobium sp. STM 3843 TaxID=551947 RepID=UPI000240431E|nr:BA14K family protein [Bradyrhizobium sp. STM 3843]CCE08584.1 hypothetical protein BRAS3843_2770066 [Bradyrhizobium sp. STM 3843]